MYNVRVFEYPTLYSLQYEYTYNIIHYTWNS